MPKKVIKKGKKTHKNKPTSKKYTKYKIISNADGTKISRERFCPRCGPGVFLLNSQGRVYCGKCHYSEFEGKKKQEENK